MRSFSWDCCDWKFAVCGSILTACVAYRFIQIGTRSVVNFLTGTLALIWYRFHGNGDGRRKAEKMDSTQHKS